MVAAVEEWRLELTNSWLQ